MCRKTTCTGPAVPGLLVTRGMRYCWCSLTGTSCWWIERLLKRALPKVVFAGYEVNSALRAGPDRRNGNGACGGGKPVNRSGTRPRGQAGNARPASAGAGHERRSRQSTRRATPAGYRDGPCIGSRLLPAGQPVQPSTCRSRAGVWMTDATSVSANSRLTRSLAIGRNNRFSKAT